LQNSTSNLFKEADMALYAGIDLHSNNSVLVVLDETDREVYRKRLPMISVRFWRPCARAEMG
jgi:hypothetical protein